MIRKLKETETQTAYQFAEKVMNEEEGGIAEKGKKSLLSYFQKHLDEYDYLASFQDEKINGLLVYEERSFRISFVIVEKGARHQDIGSSLLDTLKELAQSLNISRITVNVYGQEDFYCANGFEKDCETGSSAGISVTEWEYLCGKNQLGKKVTVVIDRPYGSFHPTLEDVEYPYNFGYVKMETSMEDAEFQDAYVIGIEEPLEQFTGYVIGIVYHKDDATSKWIVAPAGFNLPKEDIIQLLGIEEQFHDTRFLWA